METSRPQFGCLSCAITASNSIGFRLRHRTRIVSADPKESDADHPQDRTSHQSGLGAEGVLTGTETALRYTRASQWQVWRGKENFEKRRRPCLALRSRKADAQPLDPSRYATQKSQRADAH